MTSRVVKPAVLVVDDEEHAVSLLDITLGRQHHVYTATSGEVGLQLLHEHPDIAVAIIDQRMPHMSGTEFIQKTMDPYPSLIRIILTGYTDIESLIAAINAGHVFRYLTKPWDPEELRGTVQQAVDYYRIAAENRLLHEELRVTNEALRAKVAELESKDRYVATLTHELRNPITAVLGYQSLLLGTPVNDDQRSLLEGAHRCSEELDALIKTTFDLSRSNRVPIDVQETSLRELVGELFRELQLRPRKTGVELAWTVRDGVDSLQTDALKLKMILRNLITNALKFTSQGKVSLAVDEHDGGVEFRVDDSGVGIPANALPTIFDPFTQAHGAESVRKGGAGLGLFLVHRLVTVLDGRIEVESREGSGSTFRVWIPRGG